MKHTIRQVFRSGKFVVGFSIFMGILLIVTFYPLIIRDAPLKIIGQGTFFAPGIYVNVYDSMGSPHYTILLDDAAAKRIGKEVAFEADKLAKARAAVTLFRQNNKLMDPSKSAQSIGELIGKLMASKIEIESSLSTLKSVIGTESPMRNLQLTKLAAIDEQIRELKSKLTNSKGDDDVATQLGTYERLQLDEQFALAMYMAAQGAYQAARLSMNSQELYLAVVVNPALPQEAEGPRVFSSTLLLLVSLSILWAIAALLVSSVNDHVA